MDCKKVVEDYLVRKNPLYHYKYLIALIVSIFVYIYMINNHKNMNDYFQQIIIPLLVFFVVLVLIDILTKLMLNKNKVDALKKLCHLWMNDPNNNKLKDDYGLLIIDMQKVENYSGQIEGFVSKDNEQMSQDQVKKEKVVIDLVKEHEDNTLTQFGKELEPPIPHTNNNDIQGSNDFMDSAPFKSHHVELSKMEESCLFDTTCGSICSTKTTEAPCVAPIPGPQWAPQSAESVQNRLVNKNYTKNSCI